MKLSPFVEWLEKDYDELFADTEYFVHEYSDSPGLLYIIPTHDSIVWEYRNANGQHNAVRPMFEPLEMHEETCDVDKCDWEQRNDVAHSADILGREAQVI